jgi:hypothetical protein
MVSLTPTHLHASDNLSRQDLIASTTTNNAPIFHCYPSLPPSILPESQDLESAQIFSIPTATFSVPSLDICHGSQDSLPKILFEIRHLTLVVESFRRTRGATSSEMLAFSRARSKLEYNLLSMPTPQREVLIASPEQYLYEVVRITAIIYINYVLHEFDPAFGVLTKLKNKLKMVIAAGELGCGDMRPSTDVVMLWVLFMGGMLAVDMTERMWFARRVAIFTRRLKIERWEGAEEYLMRALWIRRMKDVAGEALWLAVLDVMAEERVRIVDGECL